MQFPPYGMAISFSSGTDPGTASAARNPKIPIIARRPLLISITSRRSFFSADIFLLKPNGEQRNKVKDGPARIEPDRKWYGNVRTIDQKNLEKFRVEMATHANDPYQVL